MSIQPQISIIVPVYNAGVHFSKCLDSLTNQTLREVEIILVLDCPTDGSDKVAKAYAEKDSRIKIVQNETNLHIGLSRNEGLQHANGKYIAFFDHDDYCELNMFELLYNKAQNEDLDVVRCNFVFDYLSEGEKYQSLKYQYPCELEKASRDTAIRQILHRDYTTQFWNYLFRAEIINKHQISFVDTRTCNTEDGIFVLEMLLATPKIGSIPDYLYYHTEHTTNSAKNYGYSGVKASICYVEEVELRIKKYKAEKEFYHDYLAGLGYTFYSLFKKNITKKNFKESSFIINSIKCSKLSDRINYLLNPKNFFTWLKIKPTVFLFLIIVRFSKKQPIQN